MGNKTSFSIDFTEFDKLFFRQVNRTFPNATLKALDFVGADVLADAIKEEPTVPKDTGNLRRTQAFLPAVMKGRDPEKVIGFEAEYAAATHEAPEDLNWQEPGSGPKYLESKLMKNKERYMAKTARLAKEFSGQ